MARILVVEDSADNMKLFKAVLGLHGHEVSGLPDGQGLLAALDRVQPALVLMDIQLPCCDGFTLLDEIRTSSHRDVLVVALTARAMAGDKDRALEAGFNGYITKPIDVRAFPAQITEVLARGGGTDFA